jgi:hypothetical protein
MPPLFCLLTATQSPRRFEVSESFPPFSEFRSKEQPEMAHTAEAVRDEMRGHVRAVAELVPEESRKAALRFAANVLRLPYCRVKSLFYGEARRIDAHEADKIRAYVQAAAKLIQARADYEKQRAEFLAAGAPLVRLAPRPLPRTETVAAAEEVVARRTK